MAILKAVPGWEFFDKETMDSLGLPENVYRLAIDAAYDSAVTITCEYYLDGDRAEGLAKRVKKFVLHEISDEEQEETENATE